MTQTRPMRAALYARFSTDKQRPASIADQLRDCRALASRIGATIFREYDDPALSGTADLNRPGLQALLADARAGRFDVVIVEHQDRLSRAGAGTWEAYEDLKALGVAIHAVDGGRASTMSTGVHALVSAVTIEGIVHKTRRGLEGRVLAGKSAGGCAYGYKVHRELQADGSVTTGELEIAEAEAEVVRRIHRQYASGMSPRAIAAQLNAEGVPGPRGGLWNASTINGNKERGDGILNNELYRGVRVWGRESWIKDRRTGRRRRARAPALLQPVRAPAPELRIVSDDLWADVKARQEAVALGPMTRPETLRRPKRLLSGLLRCGACGGPMILGGPDGRLLCSRRRERGPMACEGARSPRYAAVEAVVMKAVKRDLLHPEVIETAAAEFRRLMAERTRTAGQRRAQLSRRLKEATAAAETLAEVIARRPLPTLIDKLERLEAERSHMLDDMKTLGAEEKVVTLHADAGALYRGAIERLESALERDDSLHVAEARESIRGIVMGVHIIPEPGRGAYHVELESDIARILLSDETRAMLGQRWVRGRAPPADLAAFSMPIRVSA